MTRDDGPAPGTQRSVAELLAAYGAETRRPAGADGGPEGTATRVGRAASRSTRDAVADAWASERSPVPRPAAPAPAAPAPDQPAPDQPAPAPAARYGDAPAAPVPPSRAAGAPWSPAPWSPAPGPASGGPVTPYPSRLPAPVTSSSATDTDAPPTAPGVRPVGPGPADDARPPAAAPTGVGPTRGWTDAPAGLGGPGPRDPWAARPEPVDDLDDRPDDEFDDIDTDLGAGYETGYDTGPGYMYELDDPDDEDGERGPWAPLGVREWALFALQLVLGALLGAALWIVFSYLWQSLPVVALVLALGATTGLVFGVRALRRSDDLKTTVLAVVVGLMVTVSPAAFWLYAR